MRKKMSSLLLCLTFLFAPPLVAFAVNQVNTTPTHVTIQIRLADSATITDEIADVWSFGFAGKVGFRKY